MITSFVYLYSLVVISVSGGLTGIVCNVFPSRYPHALVCTPGSPFFLCTKNDYTMWWVEEKAYIFIYIEYGSFSVT